MYFYIDYIVLEISIVFFLLINLQFVVSQKSITSKLIRRCKSLEAINGDNLVEAKLLLFAKNSAIGILSNQSSY